MDVNTKIGLVIAVLGIGIAIVALFAPYEWRDMKPWVRRAGLGIGLSLVAIAVAMLFFLPTESKPEVILVFIGKTPTSIQLFNKGNAVARDIKWQMVVWNVDLNDRINPLPIPSSGFDFLKPHKSGMAIDIFDTPLVKPLVKFGDRIVGTASVSCPECDRGNSYLINIQFDKGGWYSWLPYMSDGDLLVPDNASHLRQYFDMILNSIPADRRIPIRD